MKPMGFFPFLFEMQGHREPERALGHDFGVAAPPMFSSNGAIVT